MDRRGFLKSLSATGVAVACASPEELVAAAQGTRDYRPLRIPNEYSLFLPGEREALVVAPKVNEFHAASVTATLGGATQRLTVGEHLHGWMLLATFDMNGVATAVFERHVTHRGAIAYVTERGGTIALIPKQIGDLSKIRPRPINATATGKLERPLKVQPGPDTTGEYLLRSAEDPCYENVAACGAEFIGWSLVSGEGVGPERCLYLEADGTSRQYKQNAQAGWAPDLEGPLFDPSNYFPFRAPEQYRYVQGYSKRTLLGGYLPVADTGVWNAAYGGGYELMMLLPPGPDTHPIGRMRLRLTDEDIQQQKEGAAPHRDPEGHAYIDHYWNTSSNEFFQVLAGIWNYWTELYDNAMPVEIPDPWLLDAAKAGITLSRCSYRGLEPTYQIGEGAYTKIPERSHALFPVAHYEYIWAHQLWGLTESSRPYAEHYLERYVLPDGNFLYNTQDQVEGPLNVGIFLTNAARDFWYTRDPSGFLRQQPTLERMLGYVLARYEYSKRRFEKQDRRYGLIWGSPEADLGATANDFPESHPLYYQNAACVWRGVHEYVKALKAVGSTSGKPDLTALGEHYTPVAVEMRQNIQRSIEATIAVSTPEMKRAGITPFEPNDTQRRPSDLSSYENHRFMMDWFLADWGVPALDEGHLKHRELAGQQICGLHTDGDSPRTSNFMEHGTLAVKIRREDYRSFLLTLYALVCYAADSGNRYAPEDAYIPGGSPGDGNRYGWASVINSTLQPALGLRWLLCYEESNQELCHLQKAAPKHWFAKGERISVRRCPTRFGIVSWSTESISDSNWQVVLEVDPTFTGSLKLHIHPPAGGILRSTSSGAIEGSAVLIPRSALQGGNHLVLQIRA